MDSKDSLNLFLEETINSEPLLLFKKKYWSLDKTLKINKADSKYSEKNTSKGQNARIFTTGIRHYFQNFVRSPFFQNFVNLSNCHVGISVFRILSIALLFFCFFCPEI